jgi:predicted  nucleic acid-binding Zn-ribbon protein
VSERLAKYQHEISSLNRKVSVLEGRIEDMEEKLKLNAEEKQPSEKPKAMAS